MYREESECLDVLRQIIDNGKYVRYYVHIKRWTIC